MVIAGAEDAGGVGAGADPPLLPPPHATSTSDAAKLSPKESLECMPGPLRDPLGIRSEAGGDSKAGGQEEWAGTGARSHVCRPCLNEWAHISPSRACSHTTAAMAAVSVRKMRGPNPT